MDQRATAESQQKYTRVKRVALLEKLKKNLVTHKKEYADAIVGWRHQYATMLLEHAAAMVAHADKMNASDSAKNFSADGLTELPRKPQSHADAYRGVIARLEMSTDDHYHVSHDDFERYVLDQWEWKARHSLAVENYSHKG